MSPYEASRDDELSFVKGAIVRVIKKHVDGWWLVRYNGGEGFVPGTLFRRFDKRQATVYVRGVSECKELHNHISCICSWTIVDTKKVY